MAVYKDININFTRHPATNDITSISDVAAIKRSLKNLILTDQFEVPFNPNFGSGIGKLLFENYTPFLVNNLKRKMKDLIDRYEPRVTVQEIRVFASPDSYSLQVEIFFVVNPYQQIQTLQVILERTR